MAYTSYIHFFLLIAALTFNALGTELFSCLTDTEARSIVADFAVIASEQPGYVKVAKRLLTSDFISISDSVNIADGIPVGTSSMAEERLLTPRSSIQQ